MTAKELREKLADVPDDTPIEIFDGEIRYDPWVDVTCANYIGMSYFNDPEDEDYRDHPVFRII